MATRRRANRSLPTLDTSESYVTKKEKERSPLRFQTCPPIPRKLNRGYSRSRLLSAGPTKAHALSFMNRFTLSKLYDPKKKTTYLSQLYNVCDNIGEGSFGTVYKVISKEDNEFYAIKVSKVGALSLQSQYDEVRRLEKIGDDANLVKYFFAWEEKSIVFMQMELCATSLDLYAKANHDIPEAQQWDILLDILSALKHLHTRELVHLDIKPDNIMISKDGLYKLGDFGLLLDLKEHKANLREYKAAYMSEGDAKYLAREVLDRNYTTCADIFSLGITMLELAADLVLPINGYLWHQLRNGVFDNEHFKRIPNKLRTIVCKMMHPIHVKRPSVKEIFAYVTVKKVIASRKLHPRINYYEQWKRESDVGVGKPIAVCLNPKNGKGEKQCDVRGNGEGTSRDGAAANEPMEVHIENNEESDDSSACVTPPRRVSQVILYST